MAKITEYKLFHNRNEIFLKEFPKGSTNNVFSVSNIACKNKYVLISPKPKHAALIDLNYEDIFYNTIFAGNLGVGPKVIVLDMDKKFIIEEFVVGEKL